MEFAIVAGLALVGYAASQPAEVQAAELPSPYPAIGAGPDLVSKKLEADDRAETERQWRRAMDPLGTGVILPSYARIPGSYWSSAAKQTTNEKVKQTRLETFTGATNMDTSQTGTYRSKQEVPAMFSPLIARMQVTSGGTGGNPQAQYRDPYVSGIQQGVLPIAQVQVGRGVGVGPDVPAADGFHPSYRPLPKNVNAYRKNNLPGGALAGSSHVSSRARDVVVEKRLPEKFWALERRPLAEGKFEGGAQAHARRPTEPRLAEGVCGGHHVSEEAFGNPAYAFNQTYVDSEHATRPINNRNRNPQTHGQLNLRGDRAPHAMATAGCPEHAPRAVGEWDCARIDSQQREASNAYKSNLRGPDAPRTMGGIRASTTNRERSKSRYGACGAYVPANQMENLHVPEITLRQQVNHSAFGDAAPILPAHARQGADKQLLRHAKRSEQLVGLVNPPLLRKMDVRAVGAVAMRKREVPEARAGLPAPMPTGREQIGHLTTPFNKLPIDNPWARDLNLAKNQLAGNALSHDIS